LFKHVKICLALTLTEQDHAELREENVEIFLEQNPHKEVFLYATGGRVRGRTLGSVERFSFRRGCWELCGYLLDNRGSHGCASVDGSLFVVGGGGFKTNLSSCEKLVVSAEVSAEDGDRGGWTNVSQLATFRHALAVVGAGKYIYAIGGWVDGSSCSADVERYDTSLDKWEKLSPLNVARRLLGACAYDSNSLFVFGGHDLSYDTAKAERYDIQNDTWKFVVDVPVAGPASSCAIGKFIYIFVNGASVFRYSPDKDEYLELGKLPMQEWFCFDACARGASVYVVGGKVGGAFTKAVWKYDTIRNCWERMPDMLRQRRRCAVDIVIV